MRKPFFPGKIGKIYTLGFFLVCGLLLSCSHASTQQSDSGSSDSQSWPSGLAQVGGTGDGTPGGTGAGSSSGGNQSQAGGSAATNFSTAVSGKEWKLSELRISGKTTVIDRAKLNSHGAGELFTLTVEGDKISGRAAPNRYSTVYQAGENNALTLLPMISTQMAALFEPEGIKEHEYYQYLSRVKSWKLNQNKLELYTTDDNNKEAVLVYVN